jgi:hypothetical protein
MSDNHVYPALLLNRLRPGWYAGLSPVELVVVTHYAALWPPRQSPAELQTREELSAGTAALAAATTIDQAIAAVALATAALERAERTLRIQRMLDEP